MPFPPYLRELSSGPGDHFGIQVVTHLVANELQQAMQAMDDLFSNASDVAGNVAGPKRAIVQ